MDQNRWKPHCEGSTVMGFNPGYRTRRKGRFTRRVMVGNILRGSASSRIGDGGPTWRRKLERWATAGRDEGVGGRERNLRK